MKEKIKLENEKNKKEFKETEEKLKKELKEKEEKIKCQNNKLKLQENQLKKQEEQLQKKEDQMKLENAKNKKEFKENEEKLKLEIDKYKNELKQKEEQLKLEKEKNNFQQLKPEESPKTSLQFSSVVKSSLIGQEKLISDLLAEYLLKLNNSQYFISVFELINKTLTHYDKLKYFNHLNSNWQEPLDSLYNFYICFKSYINIRYENATLNDFLFQKSFKFSEIGKEEVEFIKAIKSLKISPEINILDLYHNKKEMFLKQVGENFDELKRRILYDIMNDNKKKSKNDRKCELRKIDEPQIEYDVNFDDLMNQDYNLAKFHSYNAFTKLNELYLHISNFPLFLLYSLIINCRDLNNLKIEFIIEKSKDKNNKNIELLNDISSIIIKYMVNLESFYLINLPLNKNKVPELVEALKNSKIKKLGLVNCFQKKDVLTAFIPYFSSRKNLQEIDLSNHSFNIMPYLNNTLLNYNMNKNLTSINFSCCKLNDEDITNISNYIVSSITLLFCDISKNTLSTKSCSQFGFCISKTSSLETIKMNECGINGESLLFLFNAKGSKCLKNIFLNGNNFGDIGLVSLNSFIKASPLLENIELKKCNGTDMGFTTLVNTIKILQNIKLKSINYQGNNITSRSLGILRALNEIFKSKGIVFILNKMEGEDISNINCAIFA